MQRGAPVGEERVEVAGITTRVLVAGHGDPVVLLHADGENRTDWQWVLPGLSAQHRVYAPDLPGFGGTGTPADCSPAFFERFVRHFLDVMRIDRAVLVGNSLGGLAALRVALNTPSRVSALCLVGSAGLGSGVGVALRQLALPGAGDAAALWGRTTIGAAQRCLLRVPLLFGNPFRVPRGWLVEQYGGSRGSWTRRWPRCARRSARAARSRCSPGSSPGSGRRCCCCGAAGI